MRTRTPYGWIPILVLLPLALPPVSDAGGQTGETSLRGRVISASDREPLANVEVALAHASRTTLTDEDGAFVLQDVPAGAALLQVHLLGRTSEAVEVEVAAGRPTTLLLVLDTHVVPLPGITVRVERRGAVGKLAGFHRRMGREHGQFITREEIEERDPLRTSDLVRLVPGLMLARRAPGPPSVRTSRHPQGCRIQYWLDGIPVPGFELDYVPPQDIDGIEIYRGISEVPARFRRPETCAAVVIWTRDPGAP